MSGSTFGKNFTVTTWGESHGKAIGAVVDGCPAGIPLDETDIQIDLNRRKPGESTFATSRKEDDKIEILSGVYEGKTTGTPISLLIYNTDQRSYDYSEISKVFRPGHADYTYTKKYGLRDVRGGGRSSGRETAARVAAGAIARKILLQFGVSISAYTLSIGNITIDKANFDLSEAHKNKLVMPDADAAIKVSEYLNNLKTDGDSAGGVVECVINGVPSGLGEPVFEKIDAMLAKAVLSIGAVKAVEFGVGYKSSTLTGSKNNDPFFVDEKGDVGKKTNNSGGITGGISEGFPIVLRASFKPTPSISKAQSTINVQNKNVTINIQGRHDPVIVPRAVVVVEAMIAITLTDYLFQSVLSKISLIQKALS